MSKTHVLIDMGNGTAYATRIAQDGGASADPLTTSEVIIAHLYHRVAELEAKLADNEYLIAPHVKRIARLEKELKTSLESIHGSCSERDAVIHELTDKLTSFEKYCSICGGDTGHEDWCLNEESETI